MSTSAAATATLAANANQFVLQDHTGKTKVTYYPFAPGPLIQGQEVGALLDYAGPEGTFSFRGTRIERQDTPAGQFITVVLKPQNDTGSLTFSLFLPPVNMQGKSEDFTTVGIKARKPGNILTAGAQITYETECLKGAAKIVMLPL